MANVQYKLGLGGMGELPWLTTVCAAHIAVGRSKFCLHDSSRRGQLGARAWSPLDSSFHAACDLSPFAVISHSCEYKGFAKFCDSLQQIREPAGGLRDSQTTSGISGLC
jgi:hypothetical protein